MTAVTIAQANSYEAKLLMNKHAFFNMLAEGLSRTGFSYASSATTMSLMDMVTYAKFEPHRAMEMRLQHILFLTMCTIE